MLHPRDRRQVDVARGTFLRKRRRRRPSRDATRARPPEDSLTGVFDALAAAGAPSWLTGVESPRGNSPGRDASPYPSVPVPGGGMGPPSSSSTTGSLRASAARDMRGVPVPTAGGGVAALGRGGRLWTGTASLVALVPHLEPRFVHPRVVAASNGASNDLRTDFERTHHENPRSLASLFAREDFSALVDVRPFTKAQLAAELADGCRRQLSLGQVYWYALFTTISLSVGEVYEPSSIGTMSFVMVTLFVSVRPPIHEPRAGARAPRGRTPRTAPFVYACFCAVRDGRALCPKSVSCLRVVRDRRLCL